MKKLKNVEILYYSDYWDGPLWGMCVYNNKLCWYNVIDSSSKIRKFKVREMKSWQISYELYWHSLFVTNVKAYTKFDKECINERFELLENFYDKQRRVYKGIDYSKNKIIGYFVYKE